MDDAATQRRFTRAYDSDAVDSDEIATALNRYDGLDSDGKDEFDDLLARNGDDAADFAARSDSDTFDAIVSPCGARSAPSLGGAGSLRTDRHHSVAGPSAALKQSGTCPGLPDDVRDDFVTAVSDIGDDELRNVDTKGALDSIIGFDRNAQDAATDLIDRKGADGVRLTNDATDLADNVDGLESDDVNDLIVSYDDYADASDVGRSPREIQNDLDSLAQNDVGGLYEAIRERAGGPNTNNFKGLDGEVDAAENILDSDDAEIDRLETDITTDQGPTDIDILLEDGTAIEVKNRDYDDVPSYAEDREIRELTEKMDKYAEEKDSIAIATRGNPESADVLQAVKSNIEDDYPDTTVDLRKIDSPSG
ncbi:hypothetical protein [Haloarcula sp. CBA1127]|uniref:hypothetical protein n=1 Tax=Haloarcula sp. CBA1127 TaxID=1765055 RepID=UPI00073E9C7A|nr:hypothetical protein [Haloarcula sp. CBA1127]